MNKIYLLMHGDYGHDGYIDKIFELKKDATEYIKSREIKYVKRRIYENDEEMKWYRIDCHSIITKKNTIRKTIKPNIKPASNLLYPDREKEMK